MKIELALKPCPWCKRTPDINMPIPDDQTWSWYIECRALNCAVRPRGPKINFRNTSKTDYIRFINKIEQMVEFWNTGIETIVKELKVIDLTPIIKNFDSKLFSFLPSKRIGS